MLARESGHDVGAGPTLVEHPPNATMASRGSFRKRTGCSTPLGQRAAPVATPGREVALLAGLLLPRLAIVAPLFLADAGCDPRKPSPTRPPELPREVEGVGEGAQPREGQFALLASCGGSAMRREFDPEMPQPGSLD